MRVDIVIGGHYGSEGKGSVVSWLAKENRYDLAIRTGGPNAGHTFIDGTGHIYKMRQIPCTWAFQDTDVYIPASGLIDLEVLEKELHWLYEFGYHGKVFINPRASVITEAIKHKEASITTGTTGEGIGATRAAKCLRSVPLFRDVPERFKEGFAPFLDGWTESEVQQEERRLQHIMANRDKQILIETTQGFGLSLNGPEYPYVTSTDLDTFHLLGDAEIPHNRNKDVCVWLVIRTYPIRIAGNSGYLFNETSWAELRRKHGDHIPDEFTTVTHKMRRVGDFDPELTWRAVQRCGPENIVLTFFDYVFPDSAKWSDDTQKWTKEMHHYLVHLEALINAQITHVGVGIGRIFKVPHH